MHTAGTPTTMCVVDKFVCVAFLYWFSHTTTVLGRRVTIGTATRTGISLARNVEGRSKRLYLLFLNGRPWWRDDRRSPTRGPREGVAMT